MAQDPKYVPMQAGINGGLSIIQKYTTLAEAADANILCLGITEFISKLEILNIYIFSVLDPRIKTAYFKSQWTPEKYAAVMRVVWKVVSRFYFIFQLELILFKFDDYYSHQTKITETLASGRQPELKHRNYLFFNYFHPPDVVQAGPSMQSGYGSAWMQDAICQAYNGPNEESGLDTKFNAYINSLPQATTDVVGWWGVHFNYIILFLILSLI